MIFTESERMVKAIAEALDFSHSILFVQPIPTSNHIQDLWDGLAAASHVDVQTEIMKNDDPKGVLHYYLDLFAPILWECDSSGKVICPPSCKEGWEDDGTGKGVLKITSKEPDLRERLKREGLEPSFIDFYIDRWKNACDMVATRIEQIYKVFSDIDFEQLKETTYKEEREHKVNLLKIFKNNHLVLDEFLDTIKDMKSPEIVEEILEVEDRGLLIDKFSLKSLHTELQELGFPVSRYNGFSQVYKRRQEDGNYRHISNRWLKYNDKVD